MRLWTIWAALASAAFAQPFVYYGGAVNAASFLPPGLPNGALGRGSMFTVFGRNLGPASPQQVNAFPLQTTFSGVSVELAQGGVKVSALPVFVSAGQLNVILPSTAPLGPSSLRVTYNGQTSNPIPVTVTASSVGLFSANGAGFGPGIVQNFVSDLDRPINSLTRSARPGQVEILWGTGLGPAPFADDIAPSPVTLEPTTEVFVGGKRANVSYAGRSPCCSSIDQIVFEVPPDAPTGCYVPVVVRTKSAIVSNTVTMAIHPAGAECSDSHNPLNGQRSGGKTAVAQLARETLRVDVKVTQPFDVTFDHVLATFRDQGASDFYFNALTSPPPPGTCTVYSGAASRMFSTASLFAPGGSQIDPGGPLRVDAGSSSANVPAAGGLPGTYYALLGQQHPATPSSTTFLNQGPFSISNLAGGLIVAFRAVLGSADPVDWTNRNQIATLDRNTSIDVRWAAAPGSSRGVAILGFANSTPFNAAAAFVCVASPGATSFTVPQYVLAALPASDPRDYSATARLSVVNIPQTSAVSIPGFDRSFTGWSAWSSKTVEAK